MDLRPENMRKIKGYIWEGIRKFLDARGLEIVPKHTNDAIAALYADLVDSSIVLPNDDLFSIVFSKDRAMQLHAFLESYNENITEASPLAILYKTSTAEHEQSYQEVIEAHKSRPVAFIKEHNFRSQLIECVERSSAGRILMFVDDMIVTHKVNFDDLKDINPFKTIVSLSRGRDLSYSPVLLKQLEMPQFQKSVGNLYEFNWGEIKTYSDWSYPLGVSGYMFAKPELLAMIRNISFKAPNSLEAAMQIFMPLFKNRAGVCTDKTAAVCVHSNITQTEGYNPTHGSFSIEDLLQKWREGYKIDHQQFYGKPVTDTQVQEYTFVKR